MSGPKIDERMRRIVPKLPTLDWAAVGKRISVTRTQKGWSQAVLAQHANLSVVHIGRIEKGQRGMSLDTFCCLADALNLSLDKLAYGSSADGPSDAFYGLLHGCSAAECRIMFEVAKAAKEALRSQEAIV